MNTKLCEMFTLGKLLWVLLSCTNNDRHCLQLTLNKTYSIKNTILRLHRRQFSDIRDSGILYIVQILASFFRIGFHLGIM